VSWQNIQFFSPLSPAWERVRERGEVAIKLPLAYFHPLPYPSPIKGRGEKHLELPA